MQPAAPAEKVMLIGWDAADWKVIHPLMDAGLMPHLQSLVERGASGPLHSSYPLISPLLWTSAITGKRATKHQIFGPLEARPDRSGTRPIQRFARKAKAVWQILDEAGVPSHAINFPASHPAEKLHGISISNYFALSEDQRSAQVAVFPQSYWQILNEFRVGAKEIDAASLFTFVPRALEIDQQSDDRLHAIARTLAHSATVHAAATWSLEHVPWSFAAICYTGLHQISHGFMPYHPPKLEAVSDRDFEIYSGVVTAAYQFHDLMLGRLLELAGEQATVFLISDHGFHSDHLRPPVALNSMESMLAWHRTEGIVAIAGPGVAKGRRLNGARLIDVAPTILSLFDFPAGADFDGRAWTEAQIQPSVLEARVTWEDAIPTASQPDDSPVDDESIAHLIALGYVEKPDRIATAALEHVERGDRVIKALVLLESGEALNAIAILEPLVRQYPAVLPFRISLARAYAQANQIGACRRLVQDIGAGGQETAVFHTALGVLDLASRRPASAVAHLQRAQALGVCSPDLHFTIGQAYLKMTRWRDACESFQRALTLNPEHYEAIEELAAALLGVGNYAAAAHQANKAIQSRPDRARAHYLLGLAMLRSDQPDSAIAEFHKAIAIDPRFIAALHWLAEAYLRIGNLTKAKHYQREAHLAFIQHRMARRGFKAQL